MSERGFALAIRAGVVIPVAVAGGLFASGAPPVEVVTKTFASAGGVALGLLAIYAARRAWSLAVGSGVTGDD